MAQYCKVSLLSLYILPAASAVTLQEFNSSLFHTYRLQFSHATAFKSLELLHRDGMVWNGRKRERVGMAFRLKRDFNSRQAAS